MNDQRKGSLLPTLLALLVVGLFLLPVILTLTNKSHQPQYGCVTTQVVAEDGDTLDGIVLDNCYGDKALVLNLLVRMYGTLIQVGQVIHLPVPSG